MITEITTGITTAALVAFSRWLSSREHKQTEKQITEIHLILNGELQKKIEQAREEGRQEILNKEK